MGATISTEHTDEELAALKSAEEAVWKHFDLQDKLKELEIPLPNSPENLLLPTSVRLWQMGPDSGQPVLIIHGGGGTPADFAAMLPPLSALSNNRYRILLLERPGSGRSAPCDFSKVNKIDEFHNQLLLGVLEALKIPKIHLAANSMGGCIAVWFAQAYPEKLLSFSFISVPAGFEGMKLPFIFHVLGSPVGKQIMSRPPPRSMAEDLFKMHFHSNMDKVPDVTIDYIWTTQKTRNNSLSWQSLLARVLPSFWGGAWPFGWKLEQLEEFPSKFPCLFLVGSKDNDMMTDEQQELVGAYFGGNKYVIGEGHLPWLEDPDGVAKALVDFWNQADQ